RIKRLRGRITGAFYLRKKLIDKCGNSQELQYKHRRQMSTLNQNTAESESVVRRLLELNLKITSIMAFMNCNDDVHIGTDICHIRLSEKGNNFQLLPPQIVEQFMDIDMEENVQFIKQRSDKWFEYRKKFRVTGSTLNSAIGLDTLNKQKEHHYVRVRGRQPAPVPPELQKKFDHGTKNEVNATATFISTVLPAYLPACFAFYEVGPASINSEKRDNLLEVSADGILQCSHGGKDCPNYHIHGERRILIEMKSPVPQENIAETIFYEVPARYVPQVQAQMKAYNCNELWLLCSTAISCSVIAVRFDEELWNNIWSVVIDLYEEDRPNVPTRLHPCVKDLKLKISESKKRYTKFMCEVPTVTGEYGDITLPQNFCSPYGPAPGRIEVVCTTEHITRLNYEVAADAKSAFKECHQVLRDPAKELLVFMLTDKDRKQDNNIPYSYPVAYAMKGCSMTNNHLHFMVQKVREQLRNRNIPILCEAYDGQWHKYVTENESKCLTKLHCRDN
ncbi:MAG: YqaJ viral recombinase family protein, partial [Proteobacteria bacterium]|nr:YqaJ viral recombinase family protein [Pseudomonadota bacterium]